jgi:acetate---CoA ligase (ADP-forming)
MDPVFGPVVMLGDGGKYIEALPDVSLLLPPFSKAEALAALQRLRMAPILKGVRGAPPLDIEALAEAALRLAAIITSARGQIAAIDLNPVMVGAQGQGITVLDALIERRQG